MDEHEIDLVNMTDDEISELMTQPYLESLELLRRGALGKANYSETQCILMWEVGPLFTVRELSDCMGISNTAANKWIRWWLKRGWIIVFKKGGHGPGKATQYEWVDDLEELIEMEEYDAL